MFGKIAGNDLTVRLNARDAEMLRGGSQIEGTLDTKAIGTEIPVTVRLLPARAINYGFKAPGSLCAGRDGKYLVTTRMHQLGADYGTLSYGYAGIARVDVSMTPEMLADALERGNDLFMYQVGGNIRTHDYFLRIVPIPFVSREERPASGVAAQTQPTACANTEWCSRARSDQP